MHTAASQVQADRAPFPSLPDSRGLKSLPEDTPQLMRTRSDVGVRRRGNVRTPSDQRRIRRHRFSINGHFYNHKVEGTGMRVQGSPTGSLFLESCHLWVTDAWEAIQSLGPGWAEALLALCNLRTPGALLDGGREETSPRQDLPALSPSLPPFPGKSTLLFFFKFY